MSEKRKYLDYIGLTNLIDKIKELFTSSVADWNQNDESAYDYVKNRICYETDPVENVILEEQTLSDFSLWDTNLYGSDSATISSEFNIGYNYTVIYDGIRYENLICFNDNGFPTIGTAWNELDEESECPFCIYAWLGDVMYFGIVVPDIINTSHTLKIIHNNTNIKKIDEKFLPEIDLVGKSGTGEYAEIFNLYDNISSGYCSHAEGNGTTASAEGAHAEGTNTVASGGCSHVEGMSSTASGNYSHAEGYTTTASGYCSHAEGYWTKALSGYQHVQGKYNVLDSTSTYAHIVGNGTATNKRSNAHTLDWKGNAWFAGKVYVGGTSQDDASELKAISLPDITEDDAGKFLRVQSDGTWGIELIENASDMTF